MAKYEILGFGADSVTLWTLGTSLKGDFEKLQKYWRTYTRRMNRDQQFNPIFRVHENGSKSGHSHIHFIHYGFLDHRKTVETWRSITGEKSNVNFRKKESGDFNKALWYCLKYVTKESRNYSFLGAFYKTKVPKYNKQCELCISQEFKLYDL
jgi:hypothetical protein